MKKISSLLLSIVFLSCKDDKNNKQADINSGNDKTVNTHQQTDSAGWLKDFREFRNAVYQSNRNQVKNFIDFPIMNYNNEIWDLVYEGTKKEKNIDPEKIKPFTEQDFDKYFNKLFPKIFVSTILKIKTEELYTKSETETLNFEEGNTSYRMKAMFDKTENTLILSINSESPVKDENGEILTDGEFSIMYEFDILSDGKIKFRQVRMAG